MIDPSRNRIDLDLGDDKTPLKLWFTPGALYAVEEQIGRRLPFAKLGETIDECLGPGTLATFVWAARLWEDPDLKLEAVRARVNFAPRPWQEIYADVHRALIFGMYGEARAKAADPIRATAIPPSSQNGTGKTSSDSPSES